MPLRTWQTTLCSFVIAGALVGAAGSATVTPALAQGPSAPADFTAIARERMPAVIAITARQRVRERETAPALPEDLPFREFFRRYFEERMDPREALGAGFVISPGGHVVTNDHVMGNAEEVQVVFGTSTRGPVRLVGRDPATDLAVLKVDPPPRMMVTAWGDSDAAEPGSWAIAIGSPFGLGGTVRVGVISAQSRDIRSGPYDDYLQTDALINRGNSGGPLFNARGEVIGVDTAIFSPIGGNVGIGFAVPSRVTRSVTDQLIRTGWVERGHIGVSLQELTPANAQALGRPNEMGVLVAAVEPGGPAARAGLRVGDIVTAFSGNPVESGRHLSRAVAAAKPGTEARITVFGDGRTKELA
ncbi:trypsin-like peptidase domain-containing protein [Microvirga lotononidis]|uniref:Trypsin-like serine protease with C-terminal PDZ domain n=1 Tax=Microvirga lotononidis TaxID=864069 RepID=I4Z203_9HYPH|nr:trypsin-like peptidase domain-containing protein [Microvirga lotononidis]EIM30245.1 trypsin-like serine protease with C-terminal PDZ domain [Microvirga lotononidis]WQO31539.1 trypsin-like peptidase domain-containing protein [Microvirga lotononidis]